MNAPATSWHEANQRYLSAEVRRLAHRITQRHAPNEPDARREPDAADAELERDVAEAVAALPMPSALDHLQVIFDLTAFERELVLLCAGFELDADLERHGPPTFALALATLRDPHWSALTPARPLRHHRLVELHRTGALVSSPLRIDERILHYLVGVGGLDARLDGVVELLSPPTDLVPSHDTAVAAIVDAWNASAWPPTVIELWGCDREARLAIAAAACDLVGLQLHRLALDGLGRELDEPQLVHLLMREALLDRVALFIDDDDGEPGDPGMTGLARRLAERVHAPIVLAARDRRRRLQRPSLAIEIKRPTMAERHALFRDALSAEQLDDRPGAARGIDRVISQFDFGASAIRAACAAARRGEAGDLGDTLWDTCRVQARPQLEQLAQRIDARMGWDDLVLPAAQRQTLHEISNRVRMRTRVYDTWGFAAKNARGLGITALFAGPSGTGKTLAAEVLACELRLDLYRIDLSHVISKYIGETERNLGRVFDAAEQGAAMLLFDEADALFGKRSEVTHSHDRYANIEIGYLLQRMEAYSGLAILTTNFREALDQAFLRRLGFVIEFAMPDAVMRGEIWRTAFPAIAPTDGLDFDQLARLSLSGGNIRNIALAAAFLAADADQPVGMAHVVAAARGEYGKLERSIPAELTRLA